MFGIDGTEFLVIILIAIIVIGPKDMPGMMKAFVRVVARMRALTQEFRGHFDDAIRQADIKESMDSLREISNSVRGLDPRRKLHEFYTSLEKQTEEHLVAKQELDYQVKTQPVDKIANKIIKQDVDIVDEYSIDRQARASVENTPKILGLTQNCNAVGEDVLTEPKKGEDMV